MTTKTTTTTTTTNNNNHAQRLPADDVMEDVTLESGNDIKQRRSPLRRMTTTTATSSSALELGATTPTNNNNNNNSNNDDNNNDNDDEMIPLSTTEHLGKNRQYWRDIILGVNDGIVSTFLLVAGVVGGNLSSTTILLTTIAAALAGGFSMFAGEFMATKSQNEVMKGEINLERLHLQKYHREEIEELDGLLELIGISSSEHTHLRDQLIDHYENNFDSLLKIMVALEFGLIEEEVRSPFRAGVVSGLSFLVGALPSVLPFAIFKKPTAGLICAAICTSFALMGVGGIKTWASRGNLFKAAMENLFIAAIGAGMAYGVGVFFNTVVHHK